jgi:hypothetical protein
MSPKCKEQMFHQAVESFSRFIDQPREKTLNELLKYWDKWDIYAINIMFIKMMYQLIFEIEKNDERSDESRPSQSYSHEERRQSILDPHFSDKDIQFHTKYKLIPKHKYNNRKIMNTIQVMLRNIHPSPEKRMTPQETKAFFESIFYE